MKWAAALLALAGCFDDNYTCESDADCNLGAAGRCELDHHCTAYDGECPLDRRYTPHSGEDSGKCFVEDTTLLDPCAGEQPAAPITDTCASIVCATETQCCRTGWTDACVQQAQMRCGIKCDTRIAVMIEKGSVTAPTNIELYDLRFDGTSWTMKERSDRSEFLVWIGPEPGSTQPRLVGLNAAQDMLMVGDQSPAMYEVDGDYQYDTFTTVDFERSGRDTAMLTSNAAPDHRAHTLLDLTTRSERDLGTAQTSAAPIERWGDFDGDPFPDAVAANNGAAFHFLQSFLDADHVNQLNDNEAANTGGGNAPPARSFEWIDFDHNGLTDLFQAGAGIQLHLATALGGVPTMPTLRIDCNPPVIQQGASNCTVPSDFDFAATPLPLAMPSGDVFDLLASIDDETQDAQLKFSSRSTDLFLFQVKTSSPRTLTTTQIALPMPCMTQQSCPLIRAIAARDLDGNGTLDFVAIDSHLNVYTGLGNGDGTFGQVNMIGTLSALGSNYTDIRMSISGALR